jgi:hypothetical protein
VTSLRPFHFYTSPNVSPPQSFRHSIHANIAYDKCVMAFASDSRFRLVDIDVSGLERNMRTAVLTTMGHASVALL